MAPALEALLDMLQPEERDKAEFLLTGARRSSAPIQSLTGHEV